MSKDKLQRMARRVKRLAAVAAEVEHREDGYAREMTRSQAAARIQQMLHPDDREQPSSRRPMPALLIINSKSGPKRDSLLRVRELVDLLAGHGISADVRVKLRKSQARRQARAAARAGCPLVVAAGGDGTVSAVARGLVGSNTVLGVIALGTYNNVATSLGIPTDVAQACALIAAAPVHAIDVGEVHARGMKRRRVFLEMGAVGIAAPLALAGQGFEKGRWDALMQHLPHALEMTPAVVGVRLDGQGPVHRAHTMLALVANTPRAGAGLVVAPHAKFDDGLLDVRVYEEMTPPALAGHFLAIKAGTVDADSRIYCSRGRKVVIRSTLPLPVVVDTKVVGSTPARFRVRTGVLLVIAGRGDGLSYPVAQSLVTAVKEYATLASAQPSVAESSEAGLPAPTSRPSRAALTTGARPLGIALAMGAAALAVTPTVSRWLSRHRR
jgi:diacylglycerol kinase (ATP)